MLPKQKLREIMFQLLFGRSFNDEPYELQINMIMKELKVSRKSVYLAMEKLEFLEQHLEDIDRLINDASKTYEFDRIQQTEKNVLRIGIYEMLYDEAIPEKVAISEAMRLCQKFSTKESAKFVNALLDKVLKDSQTS